jgi:dUTP pyrophosphatase
MSSHLHLRYTGPGRPPHRAYDDDAGLDLYTHEETTIAPHAFADVPCGIAVAFPRGWYGRITGRSSTIRTRGLLVIEGIIDEGYRGPLFAGVWNLTDQPVTVASGDRVAQMILHPTAPPLIIEYTAYLPDSARGAAGFGSSGA